MEDRQLHLLALARLGLAAKIPGTLEATVTVDDLVERGFIKRHQAQAVRAYVARHGVTCSCGERSLAPEDARAFRCPLCGASLVKNATAGSWHEAPFVKLAAGARVGPLELVGLIGEGAFGAVFEARHLSLGRRSAVKVLPAAALDERRRKRFEREVEALGRLAHPSIVKVHAAFEVQGNLCCEMELVRGETLEKRVARGGALPWRDAAALVAKLARATGHAHDAGVLHRDLKPANVIIRDADGEPLIVDFGMTRLGDRASSLTVAGALMGTPVYMAPEAFAGTTGPEVDIYALGAILYEVLTGGPPFRESELAALFYKVSHGVCPPTAAPGAPASLERVRARAMSPDPLARHATPDALAEDLERVLRGEAPAQSHAFERVSRALRQRVGLMAGVVFVGVLVVAGALVVSHTPSGSPPEVVAKPVVEHGVAPPSSASLAAQFALSAAAKGDPALRAEVQRAVELAGPEAKGLASLARALRNTDALVAFVERPEGFREEDAVGALKETQLKADLAALARDERLHSAPRLVLAPLGPALRAAWKRSTYVGTLRAPLRKLVVYVLDSVPAAVLPAELVVLAEALRTGDPDRDGSSGVSVERLEECAALVAEDPLLAGLASYYASRRAGPREAASDVERALAVARLERAGEALHVASTRALSEAEVYWERMITRRASQRLASIHEERATVATDAEERRARFERAVPLRRLAYEISVEIDRHEPVVARDGRILADDLLALGRLDQIDELVERIEEKVVLRAELARERGDPKKAVELAESAPPGPDREAVLALAHAELGHPDEARKHRDALIEIVNTSGRDSRFFVLRGRNVVERLSGLR